MSKRVECSIKRFKGAVEFKDPLPYPTVIKFERAIREKKANEEQDLGELLLPLFIESVEKWELKNFPEKPTVETWPGSPRAAAGELIAFLIGEITQIYKGSEDNDPNE
jgi:hypothetical protein